MDANDLKSVPLFSGLSKRERELVARFADEVEVPAGKVLDRGGRAIPGILRDHIRIRHGDQRRRRGRPPRSRRLLR